MIVLDGGLTRTSGSRAARGVATAAQRAKQLRLAAADEIHFTATWCTETPYLPPS